MATYLYTTAATKLLTGTLGNLTTATVKCAAVTSGYTPNQTTDSTYADISAYVLEAVAVSNVTATAGVLDCDDFVFTGTTAGTCANLVLYVDSGSPSTSHLICFFGDTVNLPVTFSGTAVSVSVASSGLLAISAA